jgi:SOS-response transcriptional repressor LexA
MAATKISQIVRTLMFKKNINAAQLARETDLPQQTIQRIVSGTSAKPHLSSLIPLSTFFGVSVEALRKGDIDLSLDSSEITEAKSIPLIRWEDLSLDLSDSNAYVAEKKIVVDQVIPGDAFAISMKDSSMEPYFPNNALLILDPNKEAVDRSFVLVKFKNTNEVIFRQLLEDGQNNYLKPLNPDFNAFQMRALTPEDTLLGVLAEFRHRY